MWQYVKAMAAAGTRIIFNNFDRKLQKHSILSS